ncbi:NADP-dependent phosphogluconate dehydrogenase [Aliisedimentitalea scapharcae]|uniref:6-phosphogluconate dehydrogenase, decarboxylating n=1 Tax=Aliisedimentitalea scapharcae TaxID=1524259 RepID=A0ABZ2XWV8_9RHOB
MKTAQIGIYGLGTMGRALALNLAEHGIVTAVANRETDWIDPFVEGASHLGENLLPAYDLESFVKRLDTPRTVLFMIPSGPPLDVMLDHVLPLLDAGDMVVDAGNADFNETVRRSARVQALGIDYVGMGVSGGARGARHGPSMMVGGDDHSWTRLAPVLCPIAARFEGDPCVAHMGPDGAGHFVKTVHNGIEYADMQMIAEIYGLLRDGGGWDAPAIGQLFRAWSGGPLASFLVDVTAIALAAMDEETHQPLVDVILDKAGQKGTGRWSVIEALKLGQSASTIEGAVGARAWSAALDVRRTAADVLPGTSVVGGLPGAHVLERALLAGRILSHAQGFDILRAASQEHAWDLDLARIAEIWRAGCILRSDLLSDIAKSLAADPPQGQLVLAPGMVALLDQSVPALRQVVGAAVQTGLPVPALSAALAWYDSLRQARGNANLIQAQRDVFGSHGFERIDKTGRFNGEWG